jgi:tetratricopeptide (TPR) repeat protein
VGPEGWLFLSRREDLRGAPPDDDPDVVADLCRMVDGLPLGVELLAARVGVSSAEDVLANLRADPRSVLTGEGTADDPHRSLNVVFDSTLALLDPGARALLARLTVCPATFDLAAVRALGGRSARVDLERLVDAALVVPVEPGPGERRFRLSDPTRTYAGSLLDDDERQEAVRRHAEHYRELLVRAGREMVGERDREWIRRLERDDANVRSALDWWIDHEPAGALGFADGLGRATQFGTHDLELCSLFDRMLDAAASDDRGDPDPVDVAYVRLRRGWPRFLTGDFEGGMGDMRDAASVFDEHDDALGAADAHRGLGHMILLATADSDAARASYTRAIESSRRAGAPLTTAMVLAESAQSLIFADRADARIDEMLDEAEAVLREADDPGGLAHVMMDRMLAAYAVDDLVAAERYADESIRWSRAGREATYEQISLVGKGVGRLHRGELDEAARLISEAVRLASDTNNLLQLGVALHAVAVHAALAGRPLEAARVRGAASVLTPTWPLFERRYGELVGTVFDDLGASLGTEMAVGAALDPDDVLELVDTLLAPR